MANWLRKYTFGVHLAVAFCSIVLATVYVRLFERNGSSGNLIWVANGLLLTYLLLAPRWRWASYLLIGMSAMIAGSALIGETWQTNLLYNALNLIEVLVGVLLLRRKSTQLPRFTDGRYLVKFVAFAVLAGPLAAGALLALILFVSSHTPPLRTLLDWITGDGLGTAITAPTMAALFQTRLRDSASARQRWIYPLLLAGVTVASFSQNRMPIFILIFPVLALLLMRLGLGWAALATLFVAAMASVCSLHGLGPFAFVDSISSREKTFQLQFFVACCTLLIYVVSVVLEERNAAEKRLQKIVSLHSLVTDNSRDVILLADLDGRCTYVSPAIERMEGWKPAELIDQELFKHAHPEDRARVEDTLKQLSQGPGEAILEYRSSSRSGKYIWVESSLLMFRDGRTRVPAGILALIRDITQRKEDEDLLLQANQALEELAVLDPLTGVANRRRFDEYLADEWNRSARLSVPLSLLLIDADSFKKLNDSCGHLSGDRCLKRIAAAAVEVAKRPQDLVARYGGDEFVVMLPDTDHYGAVQVGNQIRHTLMRQNLTERESAERHLTISIGCATLIPAPGDPAEALIQCADNALYRAKRNGSDQLSSDFVSGVPEVAGSAIRPGIASHGA